MKRIFYFLSLSIALNCVACKTAKPSSGSDANPRITGSTNAPQSYYDNARRNVAPFVVQEISTDSTYGFTQKNAVRVGGVKESLGPRNEQRYLNALRGPNGEEISYSRRGSCCAFKTPNSPFDNTGMLDAYVVTWAGNEKPLLIYINCYDDGPMYAPVGMTVAQP
jgi:hypothetical protein